VSESSLDARLIGLEAVGEPSEGRLRFPLTPHLCRPDGKLYGGTGIAATVAAMELVTGRPTLWASSQLVGVPMLGDVVDVLVEPLARGHYVDQVRVTASVGGVVAFAAVGSTATVRADGLSGTGETMPRVTAPDDSTDRMGSSQARRWGSDGGPGHHRVSQMRTALPLDGEPPFAPGHLCMWARLVDETTTTAAKLGFLGDMVPIAACDAAGVQGAGTSLDNSLRVGHLVDSEWVLLDIHGSIAHGGYGYGVAHLWSPDGVLLGTAHQTAKLFSFQSFFGSR
jgi:acyl-CoA thioesterase